MAEREAQALLRKLPKIDVLLRRRGVEALVSSHGRERVTLLLRRMVEALREEITRDAPGDARLKLWEESLEASLRGRLEEDLVSLLVPVINATGVLVHTNLGRSPLSDSAIRRMGELAAGYSTLEYDLERGDRGSRSIHARRLLATIFPGHASHVVNNNAGAVLLALNTLGEGREAIVSRGELVEIGGSFRIPDVMRKGQVVLREVGTTNRTRLADYEEAINPSTGILLKVHPSNFRIVGFTTEVSLADLAALGRRRGIPVMVDQGSGNLLDLTKQGIREEPSVADLLAQGADLVTFSGDKLLGGPQAGILIGRPEIIESVRKNPLSRALRVDKLTFAALEATLAAYVTGRASREIPLLRMMEETAESVGVRANRCAEAIERLAGGRLRLAVISGTSVVGGGAAPTAGIPTRLLAVEANGLSPDALESRLRKGSPPVIGRIQDDRLVLDLRTVSEAQESLLVQALAAAAAET
jgi:L-seryl-tRNA(Ser) seleniumtransferase